MLSQVKQNTVNPKGNLYHHSLIKLLILDHLKERNKSWDICTFMFKVLNPHLNIQKRPRYLHHHDSSQSPFVEKEIPNVVHLDEDTSEVNPSTHTTPVIPAHFVPLS